MSKNHLLTELQRQEKYLGQLPSDFTFPLFNSKKALESQRKSGYRDTAAAAREIVDNAIEAGASNVDIIFDAPRTKDGTSKKAVSAVAFIDNGSGMLPAMVRYALSWGGGTHFEDHDFIGKFGFGLPNASINQTRRVEVYSKFASDKPVMMAHLDIDEYVGEGNLQAIPAAYEAELPGFVQEFFRRSGKLFEHGTVVVWVKPDNLTYRRPAGLKEHLLDDFGVTYRNLLANFELTVEGIKVEPVDPMFLAPSARFYVPPDAGGAMCQLDETFQVSIITDERTGERSLQRVERVADLNGKNVLAAGAVRVRVSRLPLGFAVGRKTEGVKPLDEHSSARFGIRRSRRGMIFVRAGREIQTVDAFPKRDADKASGLGDWPLLQAYAYHWGIEISFHPSLDVLFGIGNDKQSVRPIEDFWRFLAEEEIDDLLMREQRFQEQCRDAAAKERRAAEALKDSGEPTMAENAASLADAALNSPNVVPEHYKEKASRELARKAREKAVDSGMTVEEEAEVIDQAAKVRPYVIEYADDRNGPFYVPSWRGRQIVVTVNRLHPFFSTLYDALLRSGTGTRAKEAVDVLLLTLARAELKARHEDLAHFYEDQRVQVWSQFISSALRVLDRSLAADEDEESGT